MTKEDFMCYNINLIFGKVNHVDYVTNMMNLPTLVEVNNFAKSKLNNV